MPPYHLDPVTLTFLRKKHEYADVYSYFFESHEPVTFIAGMYAHVRLLSLPETTRRVRELSFASAPHDSEIQFGIDGHSGSDYQQTLKALVPGDTIEVFKIKSHMTWPSPSSHVVMIAGGIGITPFRSMLRDRVEKTLPITSTVLHVARESFLYKDELQELTSEYRTTGREGLKSEIDTIATAHPDAHYYVAGSPGFVETVANEIMGKGIATIETDAFKGLLSDDSY